MGELIRNVPMSLRNDGHKILTESPLDAESKHFKILVEKVEGRTESSHMSLSMTTANAQNRPSDQELKDQRDLPESRPWEVMEQALTMFKRCHRIGLQFRCGGRGAGDGGCTASTSGAAVLFDTGFLFPETIEVRIES
ncbi:MAG: hypothetical protein U0361_12130 [Nitrospiraceae bacterium]